MSYSLLTYSPNEILTSAKMNQASDNDEALRDGTAFLDDIILEQHILDGEVSDAKWRNNVAFSAYLDTVTAIPATTHSKCPINAEHYDLGNNFNTSLSRFVAPFNGVYRFSQSVKTSETARNIFTFYKNGLEYSRVGDLAAGTAPAASGTTDMLLAAGDYVEIYTWVATTAESWLITNGNCYFSGELVTRT